ncbi:hypothetical protein ACOBQX_13140 [Actinokineospora sp. G85]|uniref:hypothetical protein n=1 Tax=Actinokineospora sp. G85 TaxID=3406626 RepID=UPI003C76BE1E
MNPPPHPGGHIAPRAAYPPPQPHGYPPYPPRPDFPPRPGYGYPLRPNGLAVGGLVTSVVGILFIPAPGLGLILGIVGWVVSTKARAVALRGEADGLGIAKGGVVCGIIATVGTLVLWTIIVITSWQRWFG